MATVIIRQGTTVKFIGRYPDLATAKAMAAVKTAEYGAGASAHTSDQDLAYNTTSVTGMTQEWSK